MNTAKAYSGLSPADLKVFHSGREVIYNLLYTAFIENPGDKLYGMLDDLMEHLTTLARDSDEETLSKGVEGLSNFITVRKSLRAEEIPEYDLDTERQYTQIFCLTNSVRTAQSHYTSEDKLSRQEPCDECLEIYAEYKFPKDKRHKEDADFIAEEMRFVSFLASQSAQFSETDSGQYRWYMEGQARFFREHLLKDGWLEKFSAEVATYKAAERLYNHLCRFMLGFIREDAVFVELCNSREVD